MNLWSIFVLVIAFASPLIAGPVSLNKNKELLKVLESYNVGFWLQQDGSKLIPRQIPRLWDSGEFTDPQNHQSENFVYLVTALREGFDFKHLTSLSFGTAGRAIFASLISSADTDTYRGQGLILGFNPAHVVGASIVDTKFSFGQFPSFEAALVSYAERIGVLSPTEVYLGSHWDKYLTPYGLKENLGLDSLALNNEILLRGVDSEGVAVSVKGVFVREDGLNTNERVKQGLLTFARKMKIPVVTIPAVRPLPLLNRYK